jgi:hypothetical protein
MDTIQITTYCQGSDFKKYVRQAVSDEFFWRDCFAKLNLSDTIETKLSNKLPAQVRDEINKILPNLIETKFLQYVNNQLPAQVLKEINNQMPTYLNNNYQMQVILANHIATLQTTLDTDVRAILHRIVGGPEYHDITQAHLNTMHMMGQDKLNDITNNISEQTRQHISNADRQINDIKSTIKTDLVQLSNSLGKVDALTQKINNVETSVFKWGVGGVVTGVLFGIALYFKGSH